MTRPLQASLVPYLVAQVIFGLLHFTIACHYEALARSLYAASTSLFNWELQKNETVLD
jgi:hypothetical protein